MLGVFEPQLLPVLTTVEAAVDAVAVADVPAADVFPRTDPDRLGTVGIDRHATDGVGHLLVEDRRPGRTGVGRLPHTAAADGNVPAALIFRVHRDVGDPAGHQGGAESAKLEPFERLGLQTRIIRRFGTVALLLRPDPKRKTEQDQCGDRPRAFHCCLHPGRRLPRRSIVDRFIGR
jgi:hypothetical protein